MGVLSGLCSELLAPGPRLTTSFHQVWKTDGYVFIFIPSKTSFIKQMQLHVFAPRPGCSPAACPVLPGIGARLPMTPYWVKSQKMDGSDPRSVRGSRTSESPGRHRNLHAAL